VDLKALPGHLARRFHQISNALFDLEMREAGLALTPIQYAALVAILENPEIDQITLAGLIAYDRTTISGVIDRLAEKGLVARVASTSDRRAKLLILLEEGKRVLEIADPLVQRSQKSLVQCLSASEVEQLTALLAKVVDNMGNISRTAR
jgi:DNA-binding MarR family transcriptional regulator